MQPPPAVSSAQGQTTFAAVAAAAAADAVGNFSVALPQTTSAVSPGMVGAGVVLLTETIMGDEVEEDFAMTAPAWAGVVVARVGARNASLAVTWLPSAFGCKILPRRDAVPYQRAPHFAPHLLSRTWGAVEVKVDGAVGAEEQAVVGVGIKLAEVREVAGTTVHRGMAMQCVEEVGQMIVIVIIVVDLRCRLTTRRNSDQHRGWEARALRRNRLPAPRNGLRLLRRPWSSVGRHKKCAWI